MRFEYIPDATPLNPDEIEGLIPIHVTNQDQLNEWEATNILKAENWLISHVGRRDILNIDFIKLLHKKMFEDTWKWAGRFRYSEKNIGVTPSLITTTLKNLLDDVTFQIENNT
jgi:fido (protein-threonine AMPylation protein)